MKSRLSAGLVLRAMAHRAHHIITVSEYSRDRIVERLGVHADNVSVAYNSAGEAFRPIASDAAMQVCRERLGLHSSFLLYAGNFRPHKNVDMLLRAYARLRREYRIDHDLCVVGSGSTDQRARLDRLAGELGISEYVRFLPHVDEDLLVAVYNASALVVVPSLEEGFGLPVVEAMSCGTPVACSRTSALPEIAGDAAAYFDPHSDSDMAFTMATVLANTELRRYMRERGLANAARFSWEQSARVHLSVYSLFLKRPESHTSFVTISPSFSQQGIAVVHRRR